MSVFDWKNMGTWPAFLGEVSLESESMSKKTVLDKFCLECNKIRVYHATRILNPDAFLENGIQISNYSDLNKLLVKNIRKYCGVVVPLSKVEEIQRQIGSRDDKKLFVVLDDRELLESSGHYAIYGSEYLMSIMVRITPPGKDCLKKFGTPTVYELFVDVKNVTESDLYGLLKEINYAMINNTGSEYIDFTFEIDKSIPGDSIAKYYHPSKITDHYNNGKLYRFNSI